MIGYQAHVMRIDLTQYGPGVFYDETMSSKNRAHSYSKEEGIKQIFSSASEHSSLIIEYVQ